MLEWNSDAYKGCFRTTWVILYVINISFSICLRGHTFTYDVRTEGKAGGCPKRDKSTDRLCEWDNDKGCWGSKNQKS